MDPLPSVQKVFLMLLQQERKQGLTAMPSQVSQVLYSGAMKNPSQKDPNIRKLPSQVPPPPSRQPSNSTSTQDFFKIMDSPFTSPCAFS
jgi:hypothetical protein